MSSFPQKDLTVGGADHFLPSLLQAINYASEISITTAFIRQTGLRLLQTALIEAIQRNAQVRILIGDYLGVTQPEALRNLMLLKDQGAEIKIFQSAGVSFHMKAYLFIKSEKGSVNEGCAFIGSSNISQSALEQGLEWNLKVDLEENPNRFSTIMSEYESIYNDPRSKVLSHQWIDDYIKRRVVLPPVQLSDAGANEIELPPEPSLIQMEALAALQQTREEKFRRGLVVMATGLGKTWLAAFDTQQMKAKRVLFVAHREEILNQAEETFVRIRPDARVGRYDSKSKDSDVDMLFASIQTIGRAQHLTTFPVNYFDYVIVDEFHHAAARTYQQLLGHFNPQFLLGLTATPERTDQSNILALCDDNLVFNKGLFEGIDSKLLCPFEYFGVADVVNYKEILWRNGKFDPAELTNRLATEGRAKHNFKHWNKHHQTRTLAFCISQKHADFMADYFNRNGVESASVHSKSQMPRNEALSRLKNGDLKVVFSVDLFNEGVDLPCIDTVLMLRPTDSKIIFLQQLGRGLRNSFDTGKEKLVILDFIGNHISFFRKPEALFKIGVTNQDRKGFIKEVKNGTLDLPAGCFVNFDLKSVGFLESLISTKVNRQIEIYSGLVESYGRRPSLAEFYRADGSVTTVRHEYGQWLNLVKSESDLSASEKVCLERYGNFFEALEVTSLKKSYKLVLLEALIELDGFVQPPTTQELAHKSFEVVQRRRSLLNDLPEEFRLFSELPGSEAKRWHSYWKGNPVNAWTKGGARLTDAFFNLKGSLFCFELEIRTEDIDTFSLLVQEVVNFRFLQYEERPVNKEPISTATITYLNREEKQDVPYFSDLRIACGHFKESRHDMNSIDTQSLPLSYGKLDPSRHFLARATGSSMNGGRNPIRSGDYLLLELITSDNAGSNNGQTIAIERQDVTGDDQYLLRTVKKKSENQYQLLAQNPEYPSIMATEEMATFARFKQVVPLADIFLHKSFMREEIPALFGLEFNTGLWRSGHVRPSKHSDQFLLATLVKKGRIQDHQYHDHFTDKDCFHWQSQNSTDVDGSVGKAIINHQSNDSLVHLFVRKHRLEAGKAAPFTYCGTVTYSEHNSTKPMNVTWSLDSELSEEVFEYFK